MKKLAKILIAAAITSSLASAVLAADYQPRIIRFGYGLAEDSNQGHAVKFFAEDLAKRTGGKLKIKRFASASLGNDSHIQNALIGGAQEMTVVSTATLVGIEDSFGIYDLPFMFRSEQEADAILDGKFGKSLAERLEVKGLVGLVY